VKRRLVRTREAEADVTEQVEFIARERPAAARRYLIALEAAFKRLARFPEVGAGCHFKRPELTGIRHWPVPGFSVFLVLYRVTEDAVEVLSVVHASRDVEAVLGRRVSVKTRARASHRAE
jgi:toxin ParE1/3/4